MQVITSVVSPSSNRKTSNGSLVEMSERATLLKLSIMDSDDHHQRHASLDVHRS